MCPGSFRLRCEIRTIDHVIMVPTFLLARNPDVGNASMVDIVDVEVVFRDYGAVLDASGHDPVGDLDANRTVGIVDAGMVAGAFDAPVFS